ncbi:hypothetical protein, partial [Flavobacterium sp. 270]|uniref:hypothetical protein n=1 Tax=Flavobacterium sp. 270 TaxID=2512114 RepID=UPI001AB0461C
DYLVSQRRRDAKVIFEMMFLLSFISLLSLNKTQMTLLKTYALALMGGKILLGRGSPQKIGRTAGLSSLSFLNSNCLNYKFQ